MPPQGMQPQTPGGLDPAMLKQILALQGQDSQRSSLERQYALADQLRADAKKQVQGIQGQRVYTAPGWANALASLGDQFVANREQSAADEKAKTLDAAAQTASQGWVDALTGKPKKKRDADADGV